MKILVINGPNLNLLGRRRPEIYGETAWNDFFGSMKSAFSGRAEIDCWQSNHEGEIIDRLHAASTEGYAGVVMNAGAFTHYSYAIADAVEAIEVPVVEVHISNVFAREESRSKSVIAPVCAGSISGFGMLSYSLAIEALINLNNSK